MMFVATGVQRHLTFTASLVYDAMFRYSISCTPEEKEEKHSNTPLGQLTRRHAKDEKDCFAHLQDKTIAE